MMVIDFDDFGANHVISEQTQSHDCRDKLDQFHYANNNLKVTLFAIPGEMTKELADWCKANETWVQLALHGFFHRDNWECASMTYEEFDARVQESQPMIDTYFVKGFKAPGWQISDGVYKWLLEHGWWVADQSYNNSRRPVELQAYVNDNGKFSANGVLFEASHHHTWDCVGNGVYEQSNLIMDLLGKTQEFKFVSEAISEAYNNEK